MSRTRPKTPSRAAQRRARLLLHSRSHLLNNDHSPVSLLNIAAIAPRSLLQARLPDARVVYCSATGASEPKHMAYMSRLGLWGSGAPFPGGFEEFLGEVGHLFCLNRHPVEPL